MKRPSMASKVSKASKETKALKTLTNRKCCVLLERVEKMCGRVPKELQGLLREAKRATKSKDQEKSQELLGSVMSRVVKVFEEEMETARDDLEKAKEQEQTLAEEQLEAETQLKDAWQQVTDFKAKLKESTKTISSKSKELASAASERKCVVQDLKQAEKECLRLREVQEKTYQPLRETSGSRKQINLLCRAAEKVGFHEELLSVAPQVLKKELARRQTFDQLVLRSLDAEFSKKSKVLQSKLEENQQNLDDSDRALDETREAVAMAKETVKQTSRKIADAEAMVVSSRKSVSLVKKKAKSLPSTLKQVGRKFEQASGRYAKFRSGPLAAYLTYQPLRVDEEHDGDTQME